MSRHAGVMAPLFSLHGSRGWGMGELPDLATFAGWLATRGFDRILLLPIGVVARPDTSPYSAISSMAIDPLYIAIEDLPEFRRAGGKPALSDEARRAIVSARESRHVRYADVRRAKDEALSVAFDLFVAEEWTALTTRGSDLAGYIARERWWLEEFSLYQAIVEATGLGSWRDWPPPLRDREPGAIDDARRSLARRMLKQQFMQWVAETQWQRARADAHARGVTVLGDMPFMVSVAGPDVWARPDEYMLDVSLGVPPDAFSADGQDWAMPTYRWDRIAATGYAWLRQRARRMAALYDGYRVDHLVGLYRTYGRPPGGEPFFNPPDESAQIAQGETILGILRGTGAAIIAEDLGTVPDFVRDSLARLNAPGCRVMRWERHWQAPGQPFIDPRTYPFMSAAMTGTHDTDTLAGWWTSGSAEERHALVALLHETGAGRFGADEPWGAPLHHAILTLMRQTGSGELFFPIQDVFGWFDRINVPGTVGDHNWTWKLPWLVDSAGDR